MPVHVRGDGGQWERESPPPPGQGSRGVFCNGNSADLTSLFASIANKALDCVRLTRLYFHWVGGSVLTCLPRCMKNYIHTRLIRYKMQDIAGNVDTSLGLSKHQL
ncbi:hypothetical protein F2P81_012166 [Scophthalmus maximus]|uniref:Uncharacterized protein n=1 Tax=Scophthalmus maximus TaxID=52904 RepID=A0A6A4SQM1_SCOMX|nr:hypothetical protein F2P81_012166 [Scophthalmus maximus]